MAGDRMVNPDQLRMFMPAGEIMDTHSPWPADVAQAGGSELDMWDQKLDEAYDSGLYHQVEQEGVQNPVKLSNQPGWGPVIADGHHRLAVMDAVAPDELVPVTHHADFWDAHPEKRAPRGSW